MNFRYDDDSMQTLSLDQVYMFEQDAATYLAGILKRKYFNNVDDEELLQIAFAVREANTSNGIRRFNGIVTCIYVAEKFIALDTVLMHAVKDTTLFKPNAKVTFQPYHEDKTLTPAAFQSSSAADKTLLAATCLLSIMLVIVTCVLMHVTGGWSACCQRLTNCLFEEVEDECIIDTKNTFNNEEEEYDEEEQESVEHSLVDDDVYDNDDPGMLGVDNPAAGLGIQTPAKSEFDDNSTLAPLGITSMRKLPRDQQESPSSGLAGMIMSRFTHYQGSKE
jgi:hypothetical protein